MDISDKTRKILWGRSGNRCSICKRELVVDATQNDDESVVGDECHIVSDKPSGPRYDSSFPALDHDGYSNLILLCRTHHKMIDDQGDTYTTHILRQMKVNHEVWVKQRLSDTEMVKPVRIKRIRNNIPRYLTRLMSGREVMNLMETALAFYMNNDELQSTEEVDLVGEFFQTIRDIGDIGSELEPKDRIGMAFDLTGSLKRMEDMGFWVFGGREIQILEGGSGSPSNFPVAFIQVLRKDNEAIIMINQESEDIKTG